MEKEMLALVNFKEGKMETFMGWMQSDEGMGVRKSVAYPEKTIGAMKPDKTGMCTFYLMDGEKVFINYKGKGTGGQGGSGDFVIVGGTGKYEKISGTGFSSRQNLKGKAGMAHSLNQMSGSFSY